MKQHRSDRSRANPTLGEALSLETKDQLQQLRNALERKAQDTVTRQLSEPRPPWRPQPNQTDTSKIVKTRVTTGSDKSEFEYWDFPNEAAVREPPPISISSTERTKFEELLESRGEISSVGNEVLFLILGLDFGTSSTKLVVRLPYEAGEPTIAIPAPEYCRSSNHPYLWQTVLWLDENGVFFPWPEPGAVILNSLKQGLIQGRSEAKISGSESTRTQAGAAYLSYVIRYAMGWLSGNRPDLFLGRKPVWFVNVGMPAASYDDKLLVDAYRRVGAAALQLAKSDCSINIQAVELMLSEAHIAKAGASEEDAASLGVAVFPETAANVAGYAKSTQNAPGLYVLVDVGAMTLDACVFRLHQDSSPGDLYAFMSAQVRPLGVESFHWFIAEGKSEVDFIHQCDRTHRPVIWHTKCHRDPNASNWRPGNDLPVFLAGGGAVNKLHRKIVESLGPWLREHTRNEGIRILDLPIPRAIELPEKLTSFSQMTVAWGLSYPLTTDIRIEPMSEIEDVPPLAVIDTSDRFISQDQV